MTLARALLPLLAVAALLAASAPAQAHAHVCVKGDTFTVAGHGGHCEATDDLHFVIGWTSEPPFTGSKNGLDLAIRFASNETAVTNVTTLTAQYEFGGKTFPLELRPQFRRDGWYTDDITPTRPGAYTVRVGGTVLGKPVNFTVQPETVSATSGIEFPEPSPDAAALQRKVADLEARIAQLEARPAGTPPTKGAVTEEPAKSTSGLAALATLGALGAAAAVVARRRR